MSPYLAILRPSDYIKNIFIVFPLFFSGEVKNYQSLTNVFVGFVGFSLVASAIYIFNDYMDQEADRLHPEKKERPLASGAIPVNRALLLMICCFAAGICIIFYLNSTAGFVTVGYTAINLAYSLFLKRFAIIDVCVIALGFDLRLYVGAYLTDIPLSNWILIITYLLALFLAFAKRRDDVMIYTTTGHRVRHVVGEYTLAFIDAIITAVASMIIITYILYTNSLEVQARLNVELLNVTTVFVIAGILRFLQVVFLKKVTFSPIGIVYHDRSLQVLILAWIMLFGFILYA